jgi:phage host-nuclease inhibitor protein Gam
MANIYDLTADMMRIQSMMDDPELDTRTLKDTMEAVEGEYEDKFEAYAKVFKSIDADIEAIEDEKDRLTQKVRILKSNRQRMKEAMEESMRLTGKTKFKTKLFSFGIQKNAPSVVMETEDISLIPAEFIRTKQEIDKTALKDALKAGVSLEGIAHLEQTESLRIR